MFEQVVFVLLLIQFYIFRLLIMVLHRQYRNEAFHTDFKLPSIKDYIQDLTINLFSQLNNDSSAKHLKLSDKPTLRRLKRGHPHDALYQLL